MSSARSWLSRPAVAPLLIVAGLFVVALVVFRQQLFDHWSFRWDFLGAYTATPAFVAATIGRGHIVSWSPFVASGFPVDVDPQAGLYFPGWWLLGALRIPATLRVLTAVQVAHVLFGATGVLALARVRRLEWKWAALAAVAFLFFGGFYGEAEHADIFRGFAYVPWLLWALTPPQGVGRWTRLAAVPFLAWLIASGAYPGQIVSFGLCGLVYVGVALRGCEASVWRRYRTALALAALASGATCLAILLPYLRAEQAHELYRAFEPTAAVRAGASLSPLDLLGLYLNNFAWTADGTVTSWAVGIPVLIGLACVGREVLRRQAPLLVCGVFALLLAMSPRIGLVGRTMADLRPLFPSRFPAADYKAVVAVVLVVLAADAWAHASLRRRQLAWRAGLVGCALLAGALLSPSTYARPTTELWLVIGVILVSVVLVAARIPATVLACVLVALVVVDGVREIDDYRFLGQLSPWRVNPAEAAPYRARDGYVRKLPALLAAGPASRPARLAPTAPLSSSPTGTDPDAAGWMGDGYHLIDYGGTIERVLWRAEHDNTVLGLLLQPWHGYTFPCSAVGCGAESVHLPPPATWRPSAVVHTLAYGPDGIVYAVEVSRPTLMVENELALEGWHSNNRNVTLVNTGTPLRGWRLAAGSYRFTATYREPGRTKQELTVVVAIAAMLGCVLVLYRQRHG
ncbi:MAG TPA: hypothetical protein VGI76_01765 [Solirubrobacteraceae bacterium]